MRCGNESVNGARALLTGLAQALAVLPGISRSGMTIAAARMAGVAPGLAAEFSFLMSLPLLVGAALLDILGFTTQHGSADSLPGWLLFAGAVVSAVVGYAALALLVRTLHSGRFWLFGPYCIAAGIITLIVL